MLIARIYEVFARICPIRAGQLRIIAFITDGAEVRKILEHIGADPQAPRIAPASGPPLWDDCDAPLGEGCRGTVRLRSGGATHTRQSGRSAHQLVTKQTGVVINGRTQARMFAAAAELRRLSGATVTPVRADINTEVGRAALLAACPAQTSWSTTTPARPPDNSPNGTTPPGSARCKPT